jgi:ABC-type glycerol-3-phosphate transport system permease component
MSMATLRALRGSERVARVMRGLSSHVVLVAAAIIMGMPFIWMVTTALKSPQEVSIFPPIWWPQTLRWDNFVTAWESAPFGRFYLNSIITTVWGVTMEVLIAAFSAYAFARIEFPGRNALFMVVLAAMMIPSQMGLLPNYVTLKHLGWINKYAGIVIPHVSSVFGAFLLRQAFLSMSSEIFDAATIDGAGHFRSLVSVALPLARPVVATLALYLFIAKWNEYMWTMIVTNTQNMRTLPVGLVMIRSAEYIIGPEHLMAATLFVLVPVLILFFMAQRQLIEGIAAGALKG